MNHRSLPTLIAFIIALALLDLPGRAGAQMLAYSPTAGFLPNGQTVYVPPDSQGNFPNGYYISVTQDDSNPSFSVAVPNAGFADFSPNDWLSVGDLYSSADEGFPWDNLVFGDYNDIVANIPCVSGTPSLGVTQNMAYYTDYWGGTLAYSGVEVDFYNPASNPDFDGLGEVFNGNDAYDAAALAATSPDAQTAFGAYFFFHEGDQEFLNDLVDYSLLSFTDGLTQQAYSAANDDDHGHYVYLNVNYGDWTWAGLGGGDVSSVLSYALSLDASGGEMTTGWIVYSLLNAGQLTVSGLSGGAYTALSDWVNTQPASWGEPIYYGLEYGVIPLDEVTDNADMLDSLDSYTQDTLGWTTDQTSTYFAHFTPPAPPAVPVTFDFYPYVPEWVEVSLPQDFALVEMSASGGPWGLHSYTGTGAINIDTVADGSDAPYPISNITITGHFPADEVANVNVQVENATGEHQIFYYDYDGGGTGYDPFPTTTKPAFYVPNPDAEYDSDSNPLYIPNDPPTSEYASGVTEYNNNSLAPYFVDAAGTLWNYVGLDANGLQQWSATYDFSGNIGYGSITSTNSNGETVTIATFNEVPPPAMYDVSVWEPDGNDALNSSGVMVQQGAMIDQGEWVEGYGAGQLYFTLPFEGYMEITGHFNPDYDDTPAIPYVANDGYSGSLAEGYYDYVYNSSTDTTTFTSDPLHGSAYADAHGTIWYYDTGNADWVAYLDVTSGADFTENAIYDDGDDDAVAGFLTGDVDKFQVNRDVLTNNLTQVNEVALIQPVYAGTTTGDMVSWSIDSLDGATYSWWATGPQGQEVDGPSGEDEWTWNINNAGPDVIDQWLTWNPGQWTIHCTVNDAYTFDFTQEIGWRTEDYLVIGQIVNTDAYNSLAPSALESLPFREANVYDAGELSGILELCEVLDLPISGVLDLLPSSLDQWFGLGDFLFWGTEDHADTPQGPFTNGYLEGLVPIGAVTYNHRLWMMQNALNQTTDAASGAPTTIAYSALSSLISAGQYRILNHYQARFLVDSDNYQIIPGSVANVSAVAAVGATKTLDIPAGTFSIPSVFSSPDFNITFTGESNPNNGYHLGWEGWQMSNYVSGRVGYEGQNTSWRVYGRDMPWVFAEIIFTVDRFYDTVSASVQTSVDTTWNDDGSNGGQGSVTGSHPFNNLSIYKLHKDSTTGEINYVRQGYPLPMNGNVEAFLNSVANGVWGTPPTEPSVQ